MEFGKECLQQRIARLKSCYVTKFSYLTRVTTPVIVLPYLDAVLLNVRHAICSMLEHDLNESQWRQCLIKPRLGGIGIMDISATVRGAYYAIHCPPPCLIAKVDTAQQLNLDPTLFSKNENPDPRNLFGEILIPLHTSISKLYDSIMELDRKSSLDVIDSLTVSQVPHPAAITTTDKEARIVAVTRLVAQPGTNL